MLEQREESRLAAGLSFGESIGADSAASDKASDAMGKCDFCILIILDVAELLKHSSVLVNEKDIHGWTALHWAVSSTKLFKNIFKCAVSFVNPSMDLH